MNMNYETLTGMAKPLIAALVTYLVAHYPLFDSATWNIILTALVAIGLAVWSGFQHTTTNLVKSVDAIAQQKDSPVKAVITKPTAAGQELAASLPTVVVAGTLDAVKAASQ